MMGQRFRLERDGDALLICDERQKKKEMVFGVSAACRVSDGMDRHLCKYQDPETFARQADLLELGQ